MQKHDQRRFSAVGIEKPMLDFNPTVAEIDGAIDATRERLFSLLSILLYGDVNASARALLLGQIFNG